MANITVYPQGKVIEAELSENLLEIMAQADLYITASCGGSQTCGKCKIIIESGEVEGGVIPGMFSDEELSKGYRLACASRIKGDLVVRIPLESLASDKRILQKVSPKRLLVTELLSKELKSVYQFEPLIKKYYLQLPLPSKDDNLDDLSRLKRELKKQAVSSNYLITPFALEKIARTLREDDFKITVSLLTDDATIINIEAGDNTRKHYALGIDIGTTSIYVSLLSLTTNEILTTASDYNGQIAYGEDVITRIIYSLKKGGLETLHFAVVKTIEKLITHVLEEEGVNRADISYLVAAGNTTMTHLLLGIGTKYLRESPYVPTINASYYLVASNIGFKFSDNVYLYTLPSVASYVGSDITAGVMRTGIFATEALTLFIDIGTNGEIVLGNKEWLVTAACSAGPAFEGGNIKHGMRATPGAIESIKIGENYDEVELLTIGDKPPCGICGTGLINIVAELWGKGLILQNGKFNTGTNTSRLRIKDGIPEYVVCYREQTAIEQADYIVEDIVITESDLNDLMRAKGAIYAGISTLLKTVELKVEAISKIIIAGNLGIHFNLESAMTIGMFPEASPEKFIFIGNSSLEGAILSACSREIKEKISLVADSITHIDLADNPGFIDEYLAALFLPHTDEKRFPHVYQKYRERKKK